MSDLLSIDSLFDGLLLGDCHNDIVTVSNIIACLNQKLVENLEDSKKVEVLTEVLNDIKLLSIPVSSELEH